jgi:predicted transcriptional regulator
LQASPWEEVRDFFHYCDNYIDPVDRAAERLTQTIPADVTLIQATTAALAKVGVTVKIVPVDAIRSYDTSTKTLTLSQFAPAATQSFQLLLQLALLTQGDLLEATLDLARFQSDAARNIAKVGLANYFAGAALMP